MRAGFGPWSQFRLPALAGAYALLYAAARFDIYKKSKERFTLVRKDQTDDVSYWRLQQENTSKHFPYVFPQMPPRFRRCRRFAQTLFLIEWSCVWLFVVGVIAAIAIMLFRGKEAILEDCIAFPLFLVFLPSVFLCRWLRNMPKFFWRCPRCGQLFPYYAPPLLRGMDELKEADCLYSMEHQCIRYVKAKFCPLIIPSVCPECKCMFFDMADDFSA